MFESKPLFYVRDSEVNDKILMTLRAVIERSLKEFLILFLDLYYRVLESSVDFRSFIEL